ncbi:MULTISPECIES: DNA phosphorothioation system sulfurtransferase DndC [Mycobacteroides]|uniref:DNA phosphorothioation system sulfurtransferase DndC n=1 Tax=Mycobacteroides TaxID=670516 RepID=UPI00092ADB47|nr:DNA phosphorothioation system sulfurtransferase DndC [Mycobacteroides abscessus]MBF9435257.1 DNA phosphorothioation system sulfurtransferase DndC [Mycobacteroides chelonae]MBN7507515.1 DNA phosphorothioation system sulfurtransferase DndC [Mycobacteroides abscessus subsp. massiliense]MDO3037433.1 DNA phosphorothioation system sulfurtransferase DndC [Mycobacteroides abscessus subsp. abscessus]MDO3111306.1 DNA phosphorothioation system sulfurtransferase DndC [Mycobacteroides abscessus subsp. ma
MKRSLPITPKRRSAFDELGFSATVEAVVRQTQELYAADTVPWVVGYSGGKDSTAVLQIVWMALQGLPKKQRHKPVHVISTDTLVENPVVASWVTHSLEVMEAAAVKSELPLTPHRLTPAVADTFWVNLIGRGYPAPRPKFRWCTERLKIKPSNTFIRDMVKAHGEAILVLGTRKAESSGRSHRMTELEARRVRDLLSPNNSLPNCLVYSPVEDWSNDDVWTFLMQENNPWGYSNKELLTMYQGASPDGECPLVVDSSTPSCGDSRFGCWTCTLVDKDKSMSAMIQNDEEKEWMLPLLDLRNALDVADDRHLRDFRRMNGSVQLFHGKPIPGPYTQDSREDWLRRLLEAQAFIRAEGPDYVRSLDLITQAELDEIRRIWVVEKHEFEDHLPAIYERAMGVPYPGRPLDEHLPLGPELIDTLREVTGGDRLHFELVRELLDVEQRYRTQSRRAGLFDSLEAAIRRNFYDDQDDALSRAQRRKAAMDRSGEQTDTPDPLDIADGYVRHAESEFVQ